MGGILHCYVLCDAFAGERGPAFTRVWLPNLLSLLVGVVDDAGESIANNVNGIDEGSPANPLPVVDHATVPPRRIWMTYG